jgi:hypothetical protein
LPGAELKRHLFALPQSRDIDRFAKLKTQRLLYRVALGQPDQEDLVELLTNDDPEAMRSLQRLTLDLSAFAHKTPDQPQTAGAPTILSISPEPETMAVPSS